MCQHNLQDSDKFWQRFHTHMLRRTHTTPINFVFLFPKMTGGQLSPLKLIIVCTLYSFTSPRIEKLKFSYFVTYEQSYVGLYFFDNPYERIIFQTVEAECSSHTESIWLKYLFSQTSFMLVKPRINSERSRCLLVVFSASLENVLVNNLVVPRWFSVFPT